MLGNVEALLFGTGLLILGILLVRYARSFTLYESRFNLWVWYKTLPEFTTKIWGEKQDLEKNWWLKYVVVNFHRITGIMLILSGLLIVVSVL